MKELVKALEWKDEALYLIDQRKLPLEETFVKVTTLEECHGAIKDMVVRGAPLIGFTAIYGMVLWIKNNRQACLEELNKAADYLNTARPTAVNLEYEVLRIKQMAVEYEGRFDAFYPIIEEHAKAQMQVLADGNLAMAKLGADELEKRCGGGKLNLMTLCNTGWLACGPMGTALGVISHMHSLGRVEKAYPSETRPYLQGIRLSSYELTKEGIPHDIVVEGAHSFLLRNKMVDAIFIGADRIVSNGDTANKVGSSSLAIVAKHYGIPFYVVAPTSSFDLGSETGDEIEIEMRSQDEVLYCGGTRLAPEGATAWNPSFDVTDASLIEGIICEKGLIKPVNKENLLKVVNS
ncbi:MAG: S-methyl-5-thioribose-1-phosphate isomerase [Halobacteriovoraceae bacterium]|nr:S-methyl-5-thioribose-1-phosphate isomerase [Halobacteriovoraceae bacterium]MBT5095393.1 S-methyl-5-thioribose-1-phosphate isomerase [Halobacteriovoraceae bacterium]